MMWAGLAHSIGTQRALSLPCSIFVNALDTPGSVFGGEPVPSFGRR